MKQKSKKIICFSLLFALIFSFAACNKNPNVNEPKPTPRIVYVTKAPNVRVNTANPRTITPTPKPGSGGNNGGGGSGGNGNNGGSSSTSAPASTDKPAGVSVPPYDPAFPQTPATHVTLNMPILNGFLFEKSNDDEKALIKLFEDKFNMSISVTQVNSISGEDLNAERSYDDEFMLKMLEEGKTLPDVIPTKIGSYLYKKLVSDGKVRPIPMDMLSNYKSLDNIVKTHAVTQAYAKSEYAGTVYGFPRLENASYPYDFKTSSMIVRKDWLKKINQNIPSTDHEFKNAMSEINKNDMDGDPQTAHFGISGQIESALFSPWLSGDLTDDWVYDEGTWKPVFASSDTLNAAKYYNDLFNTGGVDNTIFRNRPLRDNFRYNAPIADSDEAGIDIKGLHRGGVSSLANISPLEIFDAINVNFVSKSIYSEPKGEEEEKKADPIKEHYTFHAEGAEVKPETSEVVGVVPPLSVNGTTSLPFDFSDDCILFSNTLTDEQLERIFMWYEYITGGKGADIVLYGIPDVDFKFTSEGEIKQTRVSFGDRANQLAKDLYPCFDLFQLPCYTVNSVTPILGASSYYAFIYEYEKAQLELMKKATVKKPTDDQIVTIMKIKDAMRKKLLEESSEVDKDGTPLDYSLPENDTIVSALSRDVIFKDTSVEKTFEEKISSKYKDHIKKFVDSITGG